MFENAASVRRLVFRKKVTLFCILLTVGVVAFSLWGIRPNSFGFFFTSSTSEVNESRVMIMTPMEVWHPPPIRPTEVSQSEKLLLQKLLKQQESAYQFHDGREVKPKVEDKTFKKTNTFWDRYPASFQCPYDVQRVGAALDGGKEVCGFSEIQKLPECVVYSCGINNDVTFDKMILEQTNCKVRMFDVVKIKPNPAAVLNEFGTRRVNYSDKGISANTNNSLKALMTKYGDSFIHILKMDIENMEWKTLSQAVLDFPEGLPIGQLAIEIHTNHYKPIETPAFREWFYSLEKAGLRPFYKEPNPIFPKILWEYAFISVKFGMFKIEE